MSEELLSSCVIALLAIPMSAAIIVALLGSRRAELVRRVSLIATLVNLVLTGIVIFNFQHDPRRLSQSDTFKPQMKTEREVLRLVSPGNAATNAKIGPIEFYIGVDGLNIWLVGLTTLLMVSAVLGSWTSVQERVNEFFAWMLLLEVAMIGVFLSFDIVLFYVFFELTLVPLFFLIGIWGGPQRQHAARKFFIYTLAGSLITLLGVLAVVLTCYTSLHELTFQIPRLTQLVQQLGTGPAAASWLQTQRWIFLALIAGFSIKVPLFPVHTWLPLAHVEAPTAGSVLLAGVLLKIGTYGFLRLCLPLTPDASLSIGVPLIGTLAVIGIIYGSFCALAQDDIKKLVAYSSVSHLGYCMLGMFALNETGLSGSLLQMINHGLSTGGLFLLVGMLYERYHTRKMADYGGMASRLKILSLYMVFICLTSIGLPGLNGFVGEMMILFGVYDLDSPRMHGPALASFGAIGLLLGAWYLLTMLRQVFFGPLKEPHADSHHPVHDLNYREVSALAPIAVLCVLIGVAPRLFVDISTPEIKLVTNIIDKARIRTTSAIATSTADDSGRLAQRPEEARP
jgi:NADH-quinone oxidoreductase subunit M